MKRLLRRKKRHCDEDRREECTRTLHLDTAFENKGFDDMDKMDKGDVLIHSEGIYSFARWGTTVDSTEDGIRVYGTKLDFYKYTGHENLQPSDDSQKKAKQDKRQGVFNDMSIIERNCKEEQLLVEMQVGRQGSDFEDRGEKYGNDVNARKESSRVRSTAKYYSKDIAEDVAKDNTTYRWKIKQRSVKFSTAMNRDFGAETKTQSRKESSHARTTAKYWWEDIADEVAKNNSRYPWKTKESSAKFSTAPDRSFGAKMKRASGEGKLGKAIKNKSERKDSQFYLQKLGGQMDRCISLPNVDNSKNIMSYASYNASFDDTSSLSDFYIEDRSMDNPTITKTVDRITDKKLDNHCGDTISSDVPWSDLQRQQRVSETLFWGSFGVIQKVPSGRGWVGMCHFCDKLS